MPVFTRRMPDKFHLSADVLLGSYSSVQRSACVILGSGPSAAEVNADMCGEVEEYGTSVTPFGINWGGFAHQEGQYSPNPHLWTSYDPCSRFDTDMFLDPAVIKFIREDRADEYLAGDRIQAHECPNTWFFKPEKKGYINYFGEGPIIDARDSMLQAIDIAIRLGFKDIYLSGCDLHYKLNNAQVEYLRKYQPDYHNCDPENGLWDVLKTVEKSKKFIEDHPDEGKRMQKLIETLSEMGMSEIYSFGNAGCDFGKAIHVDQHSRKVATRLRLARRCLDRLGVSIKLIAPQCGMESRLSPYFPTVTAEVLRGKSHDFEIDYSKTMIREARYEEPHDFVQTEKLNKGVLEPFPKEMQNAVPINAPAE